MADDDLRDRVLRSDDQHRAVLHASGYTAPGIDPVKPTENHRVQIRVIWQSNTEPAQAKGADLHQRIRRGIIQIDLGIQVRG
ncbi:hypothetical protein D3C84_930700 [compost metagenome]